jgi:two-component system, NarL family, sensor kinase
MKVILMFLYYLIAAFSGIAQSTYKDSLIKVLQKAKADTGVINLYYKYGEIFENDLPDSAMFYYQKAKSLSHQLNYEEGIASYASYAIVILNKKGKFREGLELCKEALGIYKKLNAPKNLARAYINIGSEWQYLSDFEQASENYITALKISEQINNKLLQRVCNNNLASIFISLQQYEKGKAYAEKSLVIAKELKDDFSIASSTGNIAGAEQLLKNYNKALALYSEVKTLGERINDVSFTLDGLQGAADVYSALNKATEATDNYKKVIEMAKQNQLPEYEMYAYMGLADLYLKTGNFKGALQNAENGITLGKKMESLYELKDLYYKAAVAEEQLGNTGRALDFRKQFETLNDSVLNEKNHAAINMIEAKYEVNKKEVIIKQLEDSKKIQRLSIKQKNTLNYILLGSFLTLLLISFLSYRTYKQKQLLQIQQIKQLQNEKLLLATESILKGQEDERSRMAQDLHDGLGGMLSGVKLTLGAMKGNIILSEESGRLFTKAFEQLDSSIGEMRRVAHNMMPEALVKLGLQQALQDYCDGINESKQIVIDCEFHGLEKRMESSTEIIIYRIVQELINNIIKHADATKVLVQVMRSDAELNITIEDDGKGFNKEEALLRNGAGLKNIQSRVDYLKGYLDIKSAPDKGTSVQIDCKV